MDLISRQDAIDALKALQRCECRERDPGCWEDARDAIKALPSAERIGHWITKVRHEHYPSGKAYETDFCSVCGQRGSLEYPYCPYCGARMVSKDDT